MRGSPKLTLELTTFDDIIAASKRISGHAVRTPLLESERLNRETGMRILIKPEMLQKTGAFKFRGAYNRIAMIAPKVRNKGVVAYSSGNHGQAVALAAQMFGVPAIIVMPADAPKPKIDGTIAFGGEIIFYDRTTENREAIAAAIADDKDMTMVRPYDDVHVIAGQGTIGIEIADDLSQLGIEADQVVVPAGGGGMVAGTAIALNHLLPSIAVYAAEPDGFDDHRRSLEADIRVTNAPNTHSMADSLMAPIPGELTFAINRHLLAGGMVAGEDDIKIAMRVLFRHFKLVSEPGGATALGAVMANRKSLTGRTIVVICSGGNVDESLFTDIISTRI